MPREQRKHIRYQVIDRAVVIHGHPFNIRSQIIDISKGGLSFQYMGNQKKECGPSLDISFIQGNFYLPKLPVKCVSDEEADKGPFDCLPIRRQGVQFGELTREQMSQLEDFISGC